MTDKKPTELFYSEGTIIFRQNDPGGDILLIRSGLVEVYRTQGGRDWTLARLGKDEILGAMSVTTGGQRTASARAIAPTTVIVIPRQQMEVLLKSLPPWGHAIIKDLIARVKYCSDLFIETASANIVKRNQEEPLTLSCLIASSLPPILELLSSANRSVVLDHLAAKVAEVLGVEGQKVRDVIVCFIEENLLESKAKNKDVHGFDKSTLGRLKQYIAFVQEVEKRGQRSDAVVPLLTIGERKLMLALGEAAAALNHDGAPGEQFDIATLGSQMSQAGHEIPSLLFLKRLESLGYLSLSQDEHTTATFSPDKLITLARCYEVAKRIDPKVFSESTIKKTLMY